jgi:prevent-host-death family protein
VEASGEPLVITDRGKPVLKLVPYEQRPDVQLARFRGLVRRYERPLDPVGVEDWEGLA